MEASVRSRRGKTTNSGDRLTAATADKHILYEASVQCVEADLDFFERVFRNKRGRSPRLLKEDFCGTSALACQFVKQNPENRAWGVDLHKPTLDWGRARHVARLGDDRNRVTLLQDNVLNVTRPKVDIVCALNFSYQVFKDRESLGAYFKTARRSLGPDGIFVLDCFGGTEAMETSTEDRPIPASISIEGKKIPAFTYVWDQAKFNVVNHDVLCHIHFKFQDGTTMKRAFTYNWRLWTLPELQELILEAGFSAAEVYMEGWDDEEDEADGIYRRRRNFENMAGWVGYVVGIR